MSTSPPCDESWARSSSGRAGAKATSWRRDLARSIRSSLFAGYALALAAVLAAFGTTLYVALAGALLKETDAELRARAEALAGALEAPHGRRFYIELSDEYARYFAQSGAEAPYYAIWDASGSLVDQPNPAMTIPRPGGPGPRDRGDLREVVVPGPAGSHVLVGRGIHERREEIERFMLLALAVGAIVFALALGGGWVLAGRALAPIDRMSRAAAEISESNLTRRIEAGETETELGRLAAVLNATFDRLQTSFERQTRFTADASHELRTPLSIFLTHLELALRKDRSPEEYREALETCLKAARRMRGVVEGLLTLARADAGELRLAKEPVDLRMILEETELLLRPLAAERQVTVRVTAEAVTAPGDRERLREVVSNLLTNAIRYNRPGGTVEARLGRDGTFAVLTVTDTGIGVPEADRAHIFERFYRVDRARSREQGGSGLGLAITKWIIDAHRGSIDCTSREGDGSTFTVRIPTT